MIKLIVSLMVLSGITDAAGGKIDFTGNTRQIKIQLIRLIPAGSLITHAEDIMRDNGFACSYKTHSDFMETDPTGKSSSIRTNIQYLYCDLERSKFPRFWVSERWQIAILFTDNKVSEILVSYGLTSF